MDTISRRSERGFTLLELIASLGLSGILLSIGVANFAKVLESYTLNSALNQLQSDILLARSQAISSGCAVSIAPNSDGSSYSAIASSSCYYGSFNESDRVLFTKSLPARITTAFSTTLTANSRGFIVNQSGTPSQLTVSIAHSGTVRKRLTLSSAGRLS